MMREFAVAEPICVDLVAAEVWFHIHPSPSNADAGKGMKESSNIQYPQDDGNDHNCIEDRFDGRLHWNEAIHQPKEDAHND